MKFEVYSVERTMGSLLTTIKFKVYENIGGITRVKDDCLVTLEGAYEFGSEDLPALAENAYKEAMGITT